MIILKILLIKIVVKKIYKIINYNINKIKL